MARPYSQARLAEDQVRSRCGVAAADGDVDAIAALCRYCRGVVEAMVFTHAATLNWDEHEDAVQEALITAADRFPTFRGEADPCTWMGGVAKNVARNHRRAAERHHGRSDGLDEIPAQSSSDAPHSHVEFVGMRDWLVRNLSPDYRATFALFYLEGLSYEEIAERQIISVGTVGSRLNRIRRVVEQSARELHR